MWHDDVGFLDSGLWTLECRQLEQPHPPCPLQMSRGSLAEKPTLKQTVYLGKEKEATSSHTRIVGARRGRPKSISVFVFYYIHTVYVEKPKAGLSYDAVVCILSAVMSLPSIRCAHSRY